MSGMFGLFNRDGKPVPDELVYKMLAAMSYWSPDDHGTWINGSVALGHTMLWNTPESKLEHLPSSKACLSITMDARLDNREELVKKLDLSGCPLEKITDSDLILAAYQKWGEECPRYLLGDFAFAIWDEKEQQLFCVRDHLGIKPFYFCMKDNFFLFGNDLKGIVAHPDISRKINDEAVASFVVHWLLISSTQTFFKDIQKLPSAHTLIITPSSMRMKCYWRAEEAEKVTLPNANAYADTLRELLEQAVYDRIRSPYPIASHLSGGLDSSAIAVTAARKLREQRRTLSVFNWLHEPTNKDDPAHHEWANSNTIARQENMDHAYVSMSAEDIYHHMSNNNIAYGDSAGFWYEFQVRKAVQKKGARTILSGWGGDELSTYHGQSFLANMLKEGNLLILLRELRKRAGRTNGTLRSLLSVLYHRLFLPFLPLGLYNKMPGNRNVGKTEFQCIKQVFLPLVEKEKKKVYALTMQAPNCIRTHMLAYLHYGYLQGRIESWAASAFVNRLEYSFPLLDKRVVEFVLGVPAKYFVHNGIGRYLFRSAMSGVLPDEIVWRSRKREQYRVERFLALSFSAYKQIVKDLEDAGFTSAYGDVCLLKNLLQSPVEKEDMAFLITETGNMLSVMLCEQHLQNSRML